MDIGFTTLFKAISDACNGLTFTKEQTTGFSPRNPREAGGARQVSENKSCFKRALSEGKSQTSNSQVATISN